MEINKNSNINIRRKDRNSESWSNDNSQVNYPDYSGDDYSLGQSRDTWKQSFEHLYSDLTRLFERESSLVKAELSEKIAEVKTAGTSMVIGVFLLFIGIITLAWTGIFLLARILPIWSASALVTALFLIVGYVMTRISLARLDAERMKPRQSLDTLEEIKTSFKERINEFKIHH